MRDLFVGSLGRLNNHGGSKMFTTPNTIHVTPDYEIKTDVPTVAEFVTCSLDGRLWAFRRSRRYYVAALCFDEIDNELTFANTSVLSNANIIGRGVDWVLTDNVIVQASDDEPYVNTANLFSDNQTSFLYFALRSKDVTSAWGVSENTGNSDGYGYFTRSALLQPVNKHYSLLPAVGDWHIIKNFLVRNPDNPLADSHNSMLNIRPLIPLEFHGSTPAYGCGFDNDIFITHFNGELWARGLYHIGRCYILPAVFDEQGNPQEFYLYISPDYKKTSAVTQADWLNLGILKTSDNIYGFLTSQADSLDNGLCFKSDNPIIFDTSANQWLELSQSGSMFIDTLNHSGLVIHDDGAIFLNGDSYQCKGIRQWLAPAGIVDAITEQSVISSFDNTAIATYIQQGFFREALKSKKLLISAKAYSGKRFSLGCADTDNVKSIQVNSIQTNNGAETIAWENAYKQAVNISLLNSFSKQIEDTVAPYPIFVEEGCTGESLIDDSLWQGYRDFYEWWCANSYLWGSRYYEPLDYDFPYWPTYGYATTYGTNAWGDYVWGFDSYLHNETQKLFYIHPVSGEPIPFTLSWDDGNHNQAISNDLQTRLDFISQNSTFDVPESIAIQNGQIGYVYTHYSNENRESRFKPMASVSSEIFDWQNNSSGNLSLQNILIPKNIPRNITRSASAIFSEKYSNAKFLCDIPSAFKSSNGNISGVLTGINNPYWQNLNYWNINSRSDNEAYCTQGLHVAVAANEDGYYDGYYEKFFVFRSELHPDIFDFKSETERSNLA